MTSDLDNLFVGAIAFGMAVAFSIVALASPTLNTLMLAFLIGSFFFIGVLNLGVFLRRVLLG